jgi:hypothetical protein
LNFLFPQDTQQHEMDRKATGMMGARSVAPTPARIVGCTLRRGRKLRLGFAADAADDDARRRVVVWQWHAIQLLRFCLAPPWLSSSPKQNQNKV